jgi:hypothetical protein
MDRTLRSYGVLRDSTVEVARSDTAYLGRTIAGLLGDSSASGDSPGSSQVGGFVRASYPRT